MITVQLKIKEQISVCATKVLGDDHLAGAWLHEQNPALDQETPTRAGETEVGRRGVLNSLDRTEHGVIS